MELVFEAVGQGETLERDPCMRRERGSERTSRTPTNHECDEEHKLAKGSEKKQGRARKTWCDRRQGKCCKAEVIASVKNGQEGFPGGAVVKNSPANAGDMGSSPGPGRSHTLWSN